MLSRTLTLVIGGLLCVPSPAVAQTSRQPEIQWEVVDRFRLFIPEVAGVDGGPSASDQLMADLAAYARAQPDPIDHETTVKTEASREAYLIISKFLRTPLASGRLPFETTHWRGAGPDGPDQRPSPDRSYSDDYLYPRAYRIRASLTGVAGGDCAWRVGATELGVSPCASPVIFEVPANPLAGSDPVAVIATPVGGGDPPVETRVTVVDRFILGLGESYAAGEGNPDAPQSYGPGFDEAVFAFWNASRDPNDRWWRDPGVLDQMTPARWWDPVCHRSLYSQQMAAALVYAAQRPREAVTFAAFSCSGTEMVDGILSPQINPPGISDFGVPARNFRMTPQIEAALSLMCRNALASDARRADLRTIAAHIGLEDEPLRMATRYPTAIEAKCANGAPVRPVDALLLSVGGNDVGFAGAVKWELVPTQSGTPWGQAMLNGARNMLGVTPPWLAHRRIRYNLPLLYPVLRDALRAGLAPDDTPVLQSAYPNPLHDQQNRFCHGPNDNLLFSAMQGVLPDAGVRPAGRWRFEITGDEGQEVEDALWYPLNQAVRRNADGPRWRYINYGKAFDTRGWCAGGWDARTEFEFPGWRPDGSRVSFHPREWDAYAPRQRLFRTANDVVLTQIGSREDFRWPARRLGNGSFFATSGMFHPAGEAHTIIGIAVSQSLLQTLPSEN